MTDYYELPECIKQKYTPEEYMWLDESYKARLIELETEPEWTE